MNLTIDKFPDSAFGLEVADGEVILLPLGELRGFGLPKCITELNVLAAVQFVEALEGVDWVGSPIEVNFEHGLILRDLHKVAGAMWTYLDVVPVINRIFPSRQDAECYAARHRDPMSWQVATDSDLDATVDKVLWTPINAEGTSHE